MRYTFIAILSVAAVACGSLQPVPIRAGDACFRCARVITEARLVAQLITTNGERSSFRTPACLAKYLQNHDASVKAIFVTDHPSGTMIAVTNATFVRVIVDHQTGERDFFAFRSVTDAAMRAADARSAAVDWSTVRTLVGTEKGAD